MKMIKITKNRHTLVDDEDFIILNNMKWHAQEGQCNKCYASTYINLKPILMHVFIVNPPKGFHVDHKNGNGLDNRKINLRICSRSQNMANRAMQKNNTSGFKGVYKKRKKWAAQVKLNKKYQYLGVFDSKSKAATAYDNAAIKCFGEFSRTNNSLGLLN